MKIEDSVKTRDELEKQAEELSQRTMRVPFKEAFRRIDAGELNGLSGTIVEIRLRALKHMLDG